MLYSDALQEVVDSLKAAGLKATQEQNQVQLPGALVVPGTLTFDSLDSDVYSAEINIYLLTTNKGSKKSMDDLQELLAKARTVYEFPEAQPISLELLNVSGPDPIPGILVVLEATIS